MKTITKPLIILIFALALGLRLYGLNWDQGQHLHPDERFLTMVAADVRLPQTIQQYFDTSKSPLNPHNYPQYQFFVYGTLPLFLTKSVGTLLNLDSYGTIHLVGRFLSALFDSFNIFLLYFLSLKLFPRKTWFVYFASLVYSLSVLPIQLSHFFTVDTFLNTLLLTTFTLLVNGNFLLASIFFGFSLATKISALYFTPIIAIFFFHHLLKTKKIPATLLILLAGTILSFATFRISQPYAFTGIFKINPQFIANLVELQHMSQPNSFFPPSVQWLSKTPLLHSLQNIIFFGVGIPLSFLFLLSTSRLNIKKTPFPFWASLLWILLLFFYQGSQFAHTMRYFLIIYPFICLLTGYFASTLNRYLLSVALLLHLFLALAFISIYSRPHSRVQASNWIYQHLPPGSKITNENWDDPLPLNLPNHNSAIYSGTMLSLYDPDSPRKWQQINPVINSTDYIIMSSNRLWGSIPLVPDIYPDASRFYQDLFSQKSGFKKLIEINSYPGISLPFLSQCYYFGPTNFPSIVNHWFSVDPTCAYPGFYFRDDIAEEAFTVYDHPKVLIFSRLDN